MTVRPNIEKCSPEQVGGVREMFAFPVPEPVPVTSLPPSQPMNPESVLANQQRLRALENASVADAEAIHDARHRIYRRQPEIVKLREQLGVTP